MGGSAGDQLLDLIALIKDPAAHEKRIKEFRDREKAASEADAKLSASKSNIATDRATLKEDQEAHEKAVADFAAEKARVLATAKGFADKTDSLAAREHSVKEQEGLLETAKKQHAMEATHKEADLAARENEVAAQEKRLASWGIDLAAKEKLIADKLAKLREIAG